MNVGYKNCRDRKQLLQEIGIADFAVTELNEYLDTHPFDQQAMELYRQYQLMKNQLEKEYTQEYGPLNLDCIDQNGREWKWSMQEWPWEGGYQ